MLTPVEKEVFIAPNTAKGAWSELSMEALKIEINLPSAELKKYITPVDEKDCFEKNAMMLYPRIKDQTISHGKAAEMLGVSKAELIAFYSDMGIAYIDMDISEVIDEVDAYNKLSGAERAC